MRVEATSKKWYGRYTDDSGKTFRVPLAESKEIARRMLAKLAGDSQLASAGIADPFAEHRGRPLAEHLEDYRRYLAAKGNTPDHVAKTCSRIAAFLDGCRFAYTDDLQASAVVGQLRIRGALPPELPAVKEWHTLRELAAFLGINKASVPRVLRRLRLSGEGQGRERRFHRDLAEQMR